MKKLISLFIASLLCLVSCTDELITYIDPTPGDEPTNVVARLSISSKNTWFTTEDNLNATVKFKSTGGQVVVNVDANVKWSFTQPAKGWLEIEYDEQTSQLIFRSEANTEEKIQQEVVTLTAGDKTATITLTQNPFGTLEIAASENNFTLPARGVLTATFDVISSDADWTFETKACSWMLVERVENNQVRITLDPNDEVADRETIFSLVAGAGSASPVTEQIRVIQDRAAYVLPSIKTVPFAATPVKRKGIKVLSNYDWTWSQATGSEWLTVAKTTDSLYFAAKINPSDKSRSAVITLSAGDGKENIFTQEVVISQAGFDYDAFIIGLNVKNVNLTARLPFDKAINATIDWGDGTIEENVTTAMPQHTYTDPDYYVVSVKGTVPSLNSERINLDGKYSQMYQITEIFNWGRTGLTAVNRAFYGCEYLEKIPSDPNGAFANITSLDEMLYGCSSLKELPAGLLDHAVNVVTMNDTFYNCRMLTALPKDLLRYCTKLEEANGIFANAGLLSVDADLFAYNTELTDAGRIFAGAALPTVPEKLFANNTKITSFNALFANSEKLTSIPTKLFEKNIEVTSFRMAFANTSLGGDVPVGLFKNNTKCTTFQQTFNNTKITSVPEDLFSGCDQVTTFATCFAGCTELRTIPARLLTNSGAFAKLVKAPMNMIFKGCSSITEIPAGLFDGFTGITGFSSIFEGCTNLQTIPAGLFDTNTNVTSFSSVFKDCTAITEIPNSMLGGLTKVSSFSNLFAGCTNLKKVGSNIINGCTALTSVSSMFSGCSSLTTVAADAFAGGVKITSFNNIFEKCTSLESVPSGLFADLVKATNGSGAFAGCTALRSVPADLFATNVAVTNFSKVFNGCEVLEIAPANLFKNNIAVTDFSYAFTGCKSLKTVESIFGTSSASVKFTQTFKDCEALVSIADGLFNGLTGATTFESTFENCAVLRTLPVGLFNAQTKISTAAKCFLNCKALTAVPARMFGANTTTITLMSIFEGCDKLTTIAPDAFEKMISCTLNLTNAFRYCVNLQAVPDALFANTAKVSSYSSIFEGCTALTTVGNEVFNCANTSSLGSVFLNCSSLETIGAKPFINTSKVSMLPNLFNGCERLKGVAVSIFDEFPALTSIMQLFAGCRSMTGESPYTIVNGVKYHLYERTLENVTASGFKALTNSTRSFRGCTGLADYDKIPDASK